MKLDKKLIPVINKKLKPVAFFTQKMFKAFVKKNVID